MKTIWIKELNNLVCDWHLFDQSLILDKNGKFYSFVDTHWIESNNFLTLFHCFTYWNSES